jgi:predicted outer membrane repeat protein
MAGFTLEQVNFIDSKAKENGGVFYVKDMRG